MANLFSTSCTPRCARPLVWATLACAWLGVAGNAVAQQAVDGVEVPELEVYDALMLDFMADHAIPDAQLAIAWQGRLVFARSYSHESTQPVNNRSRFRVASVSKPITSTMIHRLVEAGELSLDDTLGQFLDLSPPPGRQADPRLADITVRQLLQHLSGLATLRDVGYDPAYHDRAIAQQMFVPLPITRGDVRSFMNGRPLANEPGTVYNYSNYGYMLLGQVLEAASGLPYGALADEMLNPLGVFDARQSRSQAHRALPGDPLYFSGTTGTTAMADAPLVVPMEYGGLNYENTAAGGGWTVSMVELVRFATALDDPQSVTALLDAPTLDLMFGRPENHVGEDTVGDWYYASGWVVRRNEAGGRDTYHNGSLPSTTAAVGRDADGLDYGVAFNRRDESSPGRLITDFYDRMAIARGQVSTWPEHDLFAQELPAAPAPAGARHSGSWYDPTHNGEGFTVTVINEDTAVIYWFTYTRDGLQAWYFGVAELDGHRMVVPELLEARGGTFGPGFDPGDVVIEPVGSLVLSFYDDQHGKADYLLHGESSAFELTRITTPYANDDPQTAGDWRTGLWYDPSHNGEGYVVEALPDGRALVYWFTYDDAGRPAWMLSSVPNAPIQTGAALPMLKPVGGNFGVAFDPERVSIDDNGQGLMSLDCEESLIAFDGGGAGFPAVELTLTRFAGYVPLPCG